MSDSGQAKVCPSCDDRFESRHSSKVYCTARCRLTAAAVRYMRRERERVEAGEQPSDQRQMAIDEAVSQCLEATYPGRRWRWTPTYDPKAIRDSGGRCEVCGGIARCGDTREGIEVSDANLIALCEACGIAHKPIPELTDDELAVVLPIRERAAAPKPVRACDDPEWAT